MPEIKSVINRFSDKHEYLSNFYWLPMILEDKIYNTVEHYFQSKKAINPKDGEIIRLADTPMEAKRLGRKVDIIDHWDNSSMFYMTKGVKAKFYQDVVLAMRLINTGNAYLIEGNSWHDNIWGDCWCHRCEDFKGQNKLGEILMKVREELKQTCHLSKTSSV